LVRILQRSKHGWDSRGYVFAMLQNLNTMPGMAWSVGSNEHCFNLVVFDKLLKRGIRLCTPRYFCEFGTTIREKVANSHNLNIRMILKSKISRKFAEAISNKAHSDLAI